MLCLSKNDFRDNSRIDTPGRSMFLHNIARPSGSAIIEYDYHPGNGWGYEVKSIDYILVVQNDQVLAWLIVGYIRGR